MKLAEALQERADINAKLDDLGMRLNKNVLVQEGESPLEDPIELKREVESLTNRLAYLIGAINKTNCYTKIGDSSITELIAKKDTLTSKLGMYRDAIYTAGDNTSRARNTEIKIISLINVRDWQREADEIAKEIRLIDNKLQENNWLTELIE